MPRKDYEKLAKLWPQEAKYQYFMSKSNYKFVDRNLFITIRDRETTCVKPYQVDLDLPHGLALDVIPLDYYPKKKSDRKKPGYMGTYILYSVHRQCLKNMVE